MVFLPLGSFRRGEERGEEGRGGEGRGGERRGEERRGVHCEARRGEARRGEATWSDSTRSAATRCEERRIEVERGGTRRRDYSRQEHAAGGETRGNAHGRPETKGRRGGDKGGRRRRFSTYLRNAEIRAATQKARDSLIFSSFPLRRSRRYAYMHRNSFFFDTHRYAPTRTNTRRYARNVLLQDTRRYAQIRRDTRNA